MIFKLVQVQKKIFRCVQVRSGIFAPTNLTIAEITGGYRLTWTDNSDNEAAFTVWYSIDGAAYSILADVNPNVETYDDLTLHQGGVISYKVRAVRSFQYSTFATSAPFVLPAIKLSDGNTVAWYNKDYGITKDINDRVSAWDDRLVPVAGTRLGNAYGVGTHPLFTSDGIKFVAARNDLLQKNYTLDQPVHIYLVVRTDIFLANTAFLDGWNLYSGALMMGGSSTFVYVRIGATFSPAVPNYLDAPYWNIIRLILDGANSKLQINANGYTNFVMPAATMGGLSLAIVGNTGSPANLTIKDCIVRNIIDTTDDDNDIYNYLKNSNGI